LLGIFVFSKGDEDMANRRFGIHGGQYVPETLMSAVQELARQYERWRKPNRRDCVEPVHRFAKKIKEAIEQ
jgi:tryptophan synthase beta subunit